MNERLTQTQLAEVIAEIEQLSQRRDAELNREEVKEILQELNLSPDLLDDALVQINRKQALKVQQRRNRLITGGVVAVLVGGIALGTLFFQNRQQTFARISTSGNRITLSQDNGGNLTTIDRQISPKVYYRVTLNEAPVGEKLSLTCDWIDPSGKVVHQSRYQTREVDKSVWQTNCYYQLGTAMSAGNWKVQMSLDNRIISSTSFLVK